MSGGAQYVDLHSHWLVGIDDGARSIEESREILSGLQALGFGLVIATPHMRPGLFDNDRTAILSAWERTREELGSLRLPELALASEHYFDDVVINRIKVGDGLPYPGGRAVLLEFYDQRFPLSISHQLFELQRQGLRPVIAHPERYQRIWEAPEVLEQLVDAGSLALLDTAALMGKYGSQPRRCAEHLLEEGLYHAACSDAHRPRDVAAVAEGMEIIRRRWGEDELDFLFNEGPRQILEGRVQT
ncbi:MAG: protein tyrosine phosphatase [Polyangiaceae bacterium]|nr:protein tyrosine phosphatase [Myxococcales bacterium]MCB9588647.1 protein tyrosine phosphatase [Polyangiaceae bacterium]MCB9605205.1 protein tyrosine phosphatase [Polyangiaceae bacterium]